MMSLMMATSQEGYIADNLGNIPWRNTFPGKNEMDFFRESTKDCVLVMGSKTYQSFGDKIPKNKKAILVLTNNSDKLFKPKDRKIFFYSDPQEIYFASQRYDRPVYCVGGNQTAILLKKYICRMVLSVLQISYGEKEGWLKIDPEVKKNFSIDFVSSFETQGFSVHYSRKDFPMTETPTYLHYMKGKGLDLRKSGSKYVSIIVPRRNGSEE